MNYEQIEDTLKTSPTLKLLRSQSVALVLSFLSREFKDAQKITVTQAELEINLGDYLGFLQENELGSYLRSPKEYLNEWCDDQLLRKTFNTLEDPVFSLMPAIEKAISWLEDLQEQEPFIGTESRFLQIFNLLKEIQDHSTIDVEARIAQLERDRDYLQEQIDKIRQSGIVEQYSATRLKERFLLANQITRQLISDFKEIEQNFRDLISKIQKSQLERDSRKGIIIGQVLDADEALKESEQGKSFYAFWNFLMSDSKRQQLKSMLQNVFELEDLQDLAHKYPLLRRLERNLQSAGGHIMQSNYHLAEKLRQMLDERNLQENRKVAELITEVLRLSLVICNDVPKELDFWSLAGQPSVTLILARPLDSLEQSETPTLSLDFSQLPAIKPEKELEELYHQFYVDEYLIAQRIATILESRSSITLKELIQIYPVTQGLSEIVAYMSIASRSDSHVIDYNLNESVTIPSLEPEVELQLSLSRITFYS